jgi:hypothetical protein
MPCDLRCLIFCQFIGNPNDSSYLYLLPSLTGKFVNILLGIMQHRDIFIFNFKTQIQQHINSANSGDADNDSQSDCHSDSVVLQMSWYLI